MYYTPDISDIFVGYECQIRNAASIKEVWDDFRLHESFIHGVYKLNSWEKNIRTPYLTKEQIEKEGWTSTDNFMVYDKGIRLKFMEDRIVKIYQHWLTMDGGYEINLYMGECPSINEFRKLMKWLKIK